MSKTKFKKMRLYINGDTNDADYVGIKVWIEDEEKKMAFDLFLKLTIEHSGKVDKIRSDFDEELEDYLYYFIPQCNEMSHSITTIENITGSTDVKLY